MFQNRLVFKELSATRAAEEEEKVVGSGIEISVNDLNEMTKRGVCVNLGISV